MIRASAPALQVHNCACTRVPVHECVHVRKGGGARKERKEKRWGRASRSCLLLSLCPTCHPSLFPPSSHLLFVLQCLLLHCCFMSGLEEDAKVPGGQKSQVGDGGWTLSSSYREARGEEYRLMARSLEVIDDCIAEAAGGQEPCCRRRSGAAACVQSGWGRCLCCYRKFMRSDMLSFWVMGVFVWVSVCNCIKLSIAVFIRFHSSRSTYLIKPCHSVLQITLNNHNFLFF